MESISSRDSANSSRNPADPSGDLGDRSRDPVRAVLSTPRTLLADVERPTASSERLLALSDASGTMQLHELWSGGDPVQLTSLPEPVSSAHYVPGTRRAVIAVDSGGDELHQLYVIDLEEASRTLVTGFDRLRALTCDPRFAHPFAGISPDGGTVAYLSNRAGGVDFDLWLCDLESGEHRLLYASASYCHPASGFSPDGRYVSVLRPGPRPLDTDLVLVEVATGRPRIPLAHPEEAAEVGSPAWQSDTVLYAASNIGREFSAVVRHDLETGETTTIPGTGETSDADVVPGGPGAMIVIENRDGASAMWRHDTETGARGEEIPLPEPGVTHAWFLEAPVVSEDGTQLHYTLSSPRLAGDIYRHDLRRRGTERITHSPAGLPPEALAEPELHTIESFDGERIPLFVFRPPDAVRERLPVVVNVHGGPEAQAMRFFDPRVQAVVAAGFAVVVPNVRGSTGYGRRYASLDDTTRRLDSVRDLRAVHGALDPLGLDPARAALWGGSYGGYMTLAGLAFQPDLWSAGVDIVGISNLVTFLENTSEYRRAHREQEYGSLARDREFLTEASPMTHADAIRAPLFVIHGRNDPRVPVTEAEQLVAGLRDRGVPCELCIYEDEGHGLARLANQLDAYPRAIEFLRGVLASPGRA
ncbi:MAG TPA: prolyl oligopeptidase family serine peptidase [Solirubrobacteraceae bacterium]|nr:prolyl oligopeptidase family serine peptidase [Solirubrobacteraceae bacterium]